jgi:hypothetical protein
MAKTPFNGDAQLLYLSCVQYVSLKMSRVRTCVNETWEKLPECISAIFAM